MWWRAVPDLVTPRSGLPTPGSGRGSAGFPFFRRPRSGNGADTQTLSAGTISRIGAKEEPEPGASPNRTPASPDPEGLATTQEWRPSVRRRSEASSGCPAASRTASSTANPSAGDRDLRAGPSTRSTPRSAERSTGGRGLRGGDEFATEASCLTVGPVGMPEVAPGPAVYVAATVRASTIEDSELGAEAAVVSTVGSRQRLRHGVSKSGIRDRKAVLTGQSVESQALRRVPWHDGVRAGA